MELPERPRDIGFVTRGVIPLCLYSFNFFCLCGRTVSFESVFIIVVETLKFFVQAYGVYLPAPIATTLFFVPSKGNKGRV